MLPRFDLNASPYPGQKVWEIDRYCTKKNDFLPKFEWEIFWE